ncbi:MAG: DsbA family protein [Gemmatimonadaceae bacterium]
MTALSGAAAMFFVLAACTTSDARGPDEVDPGAIGYSEGSAAAPVHVIYFDDYVCDDCAKFNKDAIAALREEWIAKNRARLTVVDVAWKRGSVAGAAAAWCADEQEKFWPMHDLLFSRQEVWKRKVDIPAELAAYASELGLDTVEFNRCATSKSHQRRLDLAEDATRRFGVRGTPAFVVNGRLYYGSQQWPWVHEVLLAHERGTPDAAPSPPLKTPMKQVVDSARLRFLRDSLGKLGTR